jgi:hypothetical protein
MKAPRSYAVSAALDLKAEPLHLGLRPLTHPANTRRLWLREALSKSQSGLRSSQAFDVNS